MRAMVRPSSAFAALFGSRFGLVDHPKAWRRSDQRSLWSSVRFSAWFGRASRRAHLRHNFGHRPAHLLWRRVSLGRLPGTQHGWPQRAGQHQVIMHYGHDLTPAFKLGGGTPPPFRPQPPLLVYALAMLLRAAPPL